MDTRVELRTEQRQRLVGMYEPGSQTLYIRHRGEECSFELSKLIRINTIGADPEVEAELQDRTTSL